MRIPGLLERTLPRNPTTTTTTTPQQPSLCVCCLLESVLDPDCPCTYLHSFLRSWDSHCSFPDAQCLSPSIGIKLYKWWADQEGKARSPAVQTGCHLEQAERAIAGSVRCQWHKVQKEPHTSRKEGSKQAQYTARLSTLELNTAELHVGVWCAAESTRPVSPADVVVSKFLCCPGES